MTKHFFYAAHNTHANLRNGSSGFMNTWAVSRFDSREARDSFCESHGNQCARAVTRREAEQLFRENYLCVGEPVPPGGLFGLDQFEGSNFRNEWNYEH